MDATARTVVECPADAIVAFGTNRTVLLWNPAAERMFSWSADEVLGQEPPLIPEELKTEHNAVPERERTGGQISFVTRCRDDGTLLDLRIDTRALRDRDGEVIGSLAVLRAHGVCEHRDEVLGLPAKEPQPRVPVHRGEAVAQVAAQHVGAGIQPGGSARAAVSEVLPTF